MATCAPNCTCLAHPLPASMRVRDARDRYLAENGFSLADYDAKWTPASFLGLKFAVPNTREHRRGIMVHDLHHVATGFGTDLAGEGEISAWEFNGSLKGLSAYVSSLVLLGLSTGYLVARKRTVEAGRASGRKNLFTASLDRYEALLAMTLGELRASLGVPEAGIALARRLHSRAPLGLRGASTSTSPSPSLSPSPKA